MNGEGWVEGFWEMLTRLEWATLAAAAVLLLAANWTEARSLMVGMIPTAP